MVIGEDAFNTHCYNMILYLPSESVAESYAVVNKLNYDYTEEERKAIEAIKEKRSAYVTEQMTAERTALQNAATKKRDDAVTAANNTITDEKNRKASAEAALASLGFFDFGAKMTQKKIIRNAEITIINAEEMLIAAEDEYKQDVAAIEQKVKNKAIVFRSAAAKQYKMPNWRKIKKNRPKYESYDLGYSFLSEDAFEDVDL